MQLRREDPDFVKINLYIVSVLGIPLPSEFLLGEVINIGLLLCGKSEIYYKKCIISIIKTQK